MSWSPYTKPMCYWTLNTVLHCCWEFREHWTTKGLIKFRKDDGISSPCLREQEAWRMVFSALVSSFTSWEKPCNFSEEKKRRPEIHLRFAGYSSPSLQFSAVVILKECFKKKRKTNQTWKTLILNLWMGTGKTVSIRPQHNLRIT